SASVASASVASASVASASVASASVASASVASASVASASVASASTAASTTWKVVVSLVRPSSAKTEYWPTSTSSKTTSQLPSSSAVTTSSGAAMAFWKNANTFAIAESATSVAFTVTTAFGSEVPFTSTLGPSTVEP